MGELHARRSDARALLCHRTRPTNMGVTNGKVRMASPTERHLVQLMGCLGTAVLGANDGIISTSSLILGVASAASGPAGRQQVLVACAMAMAAGEYVTVSSQSGTEQADFARETFELDHDPEREHAEFARIYAKCGIDPALTGQVATQFKAGHSARLGIATRQSVESESRAWRIHRATGRRISAVSLTPA